MNQNFVKENLEKEFEEERLILCSDAVFINVAFIFTSMYFPDKTEYAFFIVPFARLFMRRRFVKYKKAMKEEKQGFNETFI